MMTVPKSVPETHSAVATAENFEACTRQTAKTAIFNVSNAANTLETPKLEGAVFS